MKSVFFKLWNLIKEHRWLLIMEATVLFMWWLLRAVLSEGLPWILAMDNILCIGGIILIAISYVLIRKKVPIHRTYFVVGLIFGILYMILIPAFEEPDAEDHYMKAYQISNALEGFESEDIYHISMRTDDAEYDRTPEFNNLTDFDTYYQRVLNDMHVDNPERIVIEIDDYAAQPYAYIPAGVGLFISHKLGLSVTLSFLLARFFNLLIFLIVFSYAIKIIPVAKLGFFGLGLIPMVQQQSMAISIDYLIMSLTALIVAMTIRLWYEETSITWKEVLILVIAGMVLIPLKHYSYAPFVLLPILVVLKRWRDSRHSVVSTEKKQENRKMAARVLIVVVLSVVGAILLQKWSDGFSSGTTEVTSSLMSEHVVPWAEDSLAWDLPTLLRETFTGNRFVLFKIIARTFMMYGGNYWAQAFGVALGSMNMTVPSFMIYVWFFVLMLMFLRRKDQKYAFSGLARFVWALFALIIAAIVVAGMLLGWTPQLYEFVVGVQGRYFIPIIPCVFFALQTRKLEIDSKYDDGIQMFAVWQAVMVMLFVFAYFNIPHDAGYFA